MGTYSKALSNLAKQLPSERVKFGEPLSAHTTYRIGGPADLFFEAETADELLQAVNLARQNGVPVFVLGLGANILVGDLGFRGLVIKNRCSRVSFGPRWQVTADSGVVIADLIEMCKVRGLSGLEHFAGIPSTVGGALWQNLHFLAPDRVGTVYIGKILKSALILTEQGEITVVPKEFFEFDYDESILHRRKDVVLSAVFQLHAASQEAIQRIIDHNLRWRSEKHPDLRQFPSAGSVFRKIEGMGAGRLIDQCGLKGFTIGRAQVSPKHANFVVNLGGAKASDVLELIRLCQERVRERFGVDLPLEISLVGEF